jgi:hypothetical protein
VHAGWLALHWETAVAVHLRRALAHVWWHLEGHVTATWDESLALRIELLTIPAAWYRVLVAVGLAIVGIRWELAIGIGLRLRCGHRTIIGCAVWRLTHRILGLLIHLRPALCSRHVLRLLERLLVRRHGRVRHLGSDLGRHDRTLEGHTPLEVGGEVIPRLHLSVVLVHC